MDTLYGVQQKDWKCCWQDRREGESSCAFPQRTASTWHQGGQGESKITVRETTQRNCSKSSSSPRTQTGRKEKIMSRRRGAGSIFRQPGCATWTLQFFRNGKRIRESTGQTKYAVARQILNTRLGAVANGVYIERDRHPVLVSQLFEMLKQRYTMNGRKSTAALAFRWKHLEP
jgi:hypothetical protein